MYNIPYIRGAVYIGKYIKETELLRAITLGEKSFEEEVVEMNSHSTNIPVSFLAVFLSA